MADDGGSKCEQVDRIECRALALLSYTEGAVAIICKRFTLSLSHYLYLNLSVFVSLAIYLSLCMDTAQQASVVRALMAEGANDQS